MENKQDFFAHKTAIIENNAKIGNKTKIWHHSHIRSNSIIGSNCNIGKNVYVDSGVIIGDNVKIQNNVSVYDGVTIEDEVFIGPSVVFTNDLYPRAMIWEEGQRSITIVKKGASIGANSTIVCGDRIIGSYALVAAGSVVTKNIPDYGLVKGNPAKLCGFVCVCARKLIEKEKQDTCMIMSCPNCNKDIKITDYDLISSTKN